MGTVKFQNSVFGQASATKKSLSSSQAWPDEDNEGVYGLAYAASLNLLHKMVTI